MWKRDTPKWPFRFDLLLAILCLLSARDGLGQSDDAVSGETPRVSVLGRLDRHLVAAVSEAVAAARTKLHDAGCRKVFTDFQDADGRTLQQNLDRQEQTGADYLAWLIFRNGENRRPCAARGTLAMTNPGERLIYLCPLFRETQRVDPGYAAALIIHEELHSLGLRENPPSSSEITRRVIDRCGR